ncbi:hypothetical protein ACIGW1_09545 [Streptomyces sp. NPDC053780]|uniref:hypothetical protein n=1 Tax=unclassified Streptomyces TaxID=2593676 RepID=UPI003430620A
MNFRVKAARAAFTTSAIVAATILFGTQTAVAGTNDSFTVSTTGGGCGSVEFVDYGPGAPGGGNNDDYLVIHDYCSDGKGVRAYAWTDNRYHGGKNNTNGLAGAPVVWDPYQGEWNVIANDKVGIKVCLFNSNNALSNCATASRKSVDG